MGEMLALLWCGAQADEEDKFAAKLAAAPQPPPTGTALDTVLRFDHGEGVWGTAFAAFAAWAAKLYVLRCPQELSRRWTSCIWMVLMSVL